MTGYDPRNHLPDDRLARHDELRDRDDDPFPASYDQPDVSVGDFVDRFAETSTDDCTDDCRLAGRLIRINDVGGVTFLEIRDETGRVQLMARDSETDDYDGLDLLNLGDVIAAAGEPTRSNTGELSLDVSEWTMLTKALRHPPWAAHESGFGTQNRIEERAGALQLRDLNDAVRDRFRIQRVVRRYLEDEGFLEVETPVLHHIAGGADATPFETHVEAIDEDMFLRIAPELYLKRMLVGDFDRVFEVGKDFRNEDVDTSHNPEFTMLELYEAYADYEDMMALTESLVSHTVEEVTGGTTVEIGGAEVNLSPPWERVRFEEAIEQYGSVPVSEMSETEVVDAAQDHGETSEELGRDEALMELYDAVAEPAIDGPAFVTHHPASSTPLCETQPGDPTRLQRFEAVVGGVELANAYTELRDPIAQAEAFREQVEASGSEIDTDYVESLAYGMPPAAGLGIGIDRLAMLVLERNSIKDVLAFPLTSR